MAKKGSVCETALQDRGLRPTAARRRILELLARPDVHLSPEQIIDHLRGAGGRTGPATVYQNLHALADKGLLVRFTGPGGVTLYDANLSPHHHLICSACGRIQDVRIDPETLKHLKPVSFHTGKSMAGWKIAGVSMEFAGLCPACKHGV